MIFSAIAVIAFSGVSMANDIAEKEVVVEETTETLNLLQAKRNPCFLTAIKMMDIVEAETGPIKNDVVYNAAYQYYLDMCNQGGLNLDWQVILMVSYLDKKEAI